MKKTKKEYALVCKWDDGKEDIVMLTDNKDEVITECKHLNDKQPEYYSVHAYSREVTDWEVVE